MKCKECGAEMFLDDKDYNFKGNYDNYWCCEDDNCLTSCIEEVRFGQSFKEIWHSENNDEVKDYVIKHNIKRENTRDKSLEEVIRTCEDIEKNREIKADNGSMYKER